MRILIAEDEPLEAEALRKRVEALGHTVVDVVYDGSRAVAQAGQLRPDLVFLDLRMPKLDGLAAAEKILADRPVPLIVLTGQGDPALTARLGRAGVMGCLVKPVDRKELEAAIALATRRFTDPS
jgi:response regulator NasT